MGLDTLLRKGAFHHTSGLEVGVLNMWRVSISTTSSPLSLMVTFLLIITTSSSSPSEFKDELDEDLDLLLLFFFLLFFEVKDSRLDKNFLAPASESPDSEAALFLPLPFLEAGSWSSEPSSSLLFPASASEVVGSGVGVLCFFLLFAFELAELAEFFFLPFLLVFTTTTEASLSPEAPALLARCFWTGVEVTLDCEVGAGELLLEEFLSFFLFAFAARFSLSSLFFSLSISSTAASKGSTSSTWASPSSCSSSSELFSPDDEASVSVERNI